MRKIFLTALLISFCMLSFGQSNQHPGLSMDSILNARVQYLKQTLELTPEQVVAVKNASMKYQLAVTNSNRLHLDSLSDRKSQMAIKERYLHELKGLLTEVQYTSYKGAMAARDEQIRNWSHQKGLRVKGNGTQ